MAHGSLALRQGVLYVGRHAKTAWVAAYDLDGRPLGTCFSFRDERAGRSSVTGLAVDDDHRVWVADGAGGRVRAFTLFGRPVVDVADEDGAGADELGRLGSPSDVCTRGTDEELEVVVASRGRRRHAVQVFLAHAGRVRSLRPGGDPRGRFHDVRGIDVLGEWIYACEARAGRVQVFRGAHHHYTFTVAAQGGRRFEPAAVALFPDGRAVIATGGEASALLLVDRAGRLLRVLVEGGREPGAVDDPGDVVVAWGADDRQARVVAVDRDGERIQVFTLEGRCYGAFPLLTGS